MAPTKKEIGLKLRKLRKAKKWSRYKLAQRAGISQTYVRKLEEGRSDPTMGMMQKLAKALDVPLEAMLQ